MFNSILHFNIKYYLMNLQQTINDIVELEGIGLHNGVKVNICLKPKKMRVILKH